MADTGWINGSTQTIIQAFNVNSGGMLVANDSNVASYSNGGPAIARINNFSGMSAIPLGATINGIEVRILCRNTSSAQFIVINDLKFQKVAGTNVGNNLASAPVAVTNSGTYNYKIFGSSTELAGLSWTDSELKSSGFGVYFQLSNTDGEYSPGTDVDSVEVKVYYTSSITHNETASGGTCFTGGQAFVLKKSMIFAQGGIQCLGSSTISVDSEPEPEFVSKPLGNLICPDNTVAVWKIVKGAYVAAVTACLIKNLKFKA